MKMIKKKKIKKKKKKMVTMLKVYGINVVFPLTHIKEYLLYT